MVMIGKIQRLHRQSNKSQRQITRNTGLSLNAVTE